MRVVQFLTIAALAAFIPSALGWFAPPTAPCDMPDMETALEAAPVSPVYSSRIFDIPYEILFPFYSNVTLWPAYDRAYKPCVGPKCSTTWPALCQVLNASETNAVRPYAYNYTGLNVTYPVATYVNETVGTDFRISFMSNIPGVAFDRLDVEVQASRNDGFQAVNQTVVYSWEKAFGPEVDSYPAYYMYDFKMMMNRFFDSIQCLADTYKSTGELTIPDVVRLCTQAPLNKKNPAPRRVHPAHDIIGNVRRIHAQQQSRVRTRPHRK